MKIQIEDLSKHLRTPILSHCRKLNKDGMSPDTQVEFYRKETLVFSFPLKEGAKWTVLENKQTGPRFVRWEPFPVGELQGRENNES